MDNIEPDGAQEVCFISAGTREAFGATQFGLAITEVRPRARIFRVVWAPSIRQAIDVALADCASNDWMIPLDQRWWE